MKIIQVAALVACAFGEPLNAKDTTKAGIKDLPPYAFIRDIDKQVSGALSPNPIKREQQFEIVGTEDPLGNETWIFDLDSNQTCGPKGSIINVSDKLNGRRVMAFKIDKTA